MGIRVKVFRKPDWPKPIGPAGHDILSELVAKLDGVSWFLMGRSLLAVYSTGRLDETDTDIDIGCRTEDEQLVRDRLSGWRPVQETLRGRTHQLMYQPDGVLVDIHFFGVIPEHVGYVNQYDKWVTRPAGRMVAVSRSVPGYGDVGLPHDTDQWLHDDYGPKWRRKYDFAPGWRESYK